jgi:hypothetical protein
MGRFHINENMKPMDLISTPLITYRNIKVKEIDLFEDAFGLNSEFSDVISLLPRIKAVPGRCLTRNLMIKVRKTV